MSAFGKIGQSIAGMPGMNTMMKPVQGFMNKSPIMRHSPLMQHMQNRFNPQQKPGIGPSSNAQPMQQMAQGFGEFAQARPPEAQMPYQQMEGPQNTGINGGLVNPQINSGGASLGWNEFPQGRAAPNGQMGGQYGAMMGNKQNMQDMYNILPQRMQNQTAGKMMGNMIGLGPSAGGLGQMMNQKKMMGPPQRDPNAAQF